MKWCRRRQEVGALDDTENGVFNSSALEQVSHWTTNCRASTLNYLGRLWSCHYAPPLEFLYDYELETEWPSCKILVANGGYPVITPSSHWGRLIFFTASESIFYWDSLCSIKSKVTHREGFLILLEGGRGGKLKLMQKPLQSRLFAPKLTHHTLSSVSYVSITRWWTIVVQVDSSTIDFEYILAQTCPKMRRWMWWLTFEPFHKDMLWTFQWCFQPALPFNDRVIVIYAIASEGSCLFEHW